MTDTTIPCATYRLQFHRGFTFADATKIVPYLHALGITHIYASPFLKARANSLHGYDIVDHNALNPEIGTAEELDLFVARLRAHGMGLILDFVPNHMGVGGDDNQWWLDVLEHGPGSRYANYFDIDWWYPAKNELRGKVLLPVLGDHYGATLERGEIQLTFDAVKGEFVARYGIHCFPIDPRSYASLLSEIEESFSQEDSAQSLHSIIALSATLPSRYHSDLQSRQQRLELSDAVKGQLSRLCHNDDLLRKSIQEIVREFNGTAGQPRSFDRLHQLLELQAYRLAYWRVAADEINYRRFFNINELASIRVEVPEVFAATHSFILKLIAAGKVDGLRIDHPDGLYDPGAYFSELQQHIAASLKRSVHSAQRPFYIVIEKILAAHESLPSEWLIHGTTGYEYAARVNGLLVYPGGEQKLGRQYRRFIHQPLEFDDLVYRCKRLIIISHLSAELTVLANYLNAISEMDRHTRDYTLNALREALIEIVACFPVYRTYIRSRQINETDRNHINWAIAQAIIHSRAEDVTIFHFIKGLLLQEGAWTNEVADLILDFTMKFQQYTTPVFAKGMEDTAFYNYHRLTSLNEVGADPRWFGCSVEEFHRHNQERLRHWPHAMVNTSTHDSKRSEDVRARINVLSEVGDLWQACLTRWSRLNRYKKKKLDEGYAPSRNDEYLFYQTLLGIWPTTELDTTLCATLQQRIEDYMIKAMREAKKHTSWINPNADYEEATLIFLRKVLDSAQSRFLDDFTGVANRVARCGMYNSLTQKLLTLTVPGIPDNYQGNELWCLQLVDPDNRHSVDFDQYQRTLNGIMHELPTDAQLPDYLRSLIETLDDGRAKLYLTWKVLNFRRDNQKLFQQGSYLPLVCQGTLADKLCCFARAHECGKVIVVAARWYSSLLGNNEMVPIGPVWGETQLILPLELNAHVFHDILSGKTVGVQQVESKRVLPLSEVLHDLPVALLYALD
jgi:(1->4)-alpha-D-glucan 1-alpha-D-glucosylmutase